MHPTTKQWRILRKAIGSNIQYYRKIRKLTLQKLATISGIPDYIIDNYELGKSEIRLHALIKIAIAMDIDIGKLFERVN